MKIVENTIGFESLRCLCSLAVMLGCAGPAGATELFRSAADAASAGSGGVIGMEQNALVAVSANPALLGSSADGFSANLTVLSVDSEFSNAFGSRARADKGPAAVPELAWKTSLGDSGLSAGAGFTLASAMSADFFLVDPPGTQGVSYGPQPHRAEYVVGKLSGALSWAVNEKLTVGMAAGVAYNRNQLEAPYIFQSQPDLAGLKVLVDLSADDLSPHYTAGLSYQAGDVLRLNLSFSSEVDFDAEGSLGGDLSQLDMSSREDFRYDALVSTGLPAAFSASANWQAGQRLSLGLQWQRIFWEDSFASLPIALRNGDNADLNDFLGSDSIDDVAPLRWRDQDAFVLGLGYQWNETIKLRAGLELTEAPTPAETATPMTAAIFEQAFSLGLGYHSGDTQLDFFYRISDGDDLTVNESDLLGPEYDNTRQSLRLHSLGFAIKF